MKTKTTSQTAVAAALLAMGADIFEIVDSEEHDDDTYTLLGQTDPPQRVGDTLHARTGRNRKPGPGRPRTRYCPITGAGLARGARQLRSEPRILSPVG